MSISHSLVFEVDRERIVIKGFSSFRRSFRRSLVQPNRQKAVLQAVVKKNIAKTRSDHRSKTIIHQTPRSMFSRRAAAEIRPGNKDRRTGVTRIVQNKIRFWRAVGFRPPIIKQKRTVTRSLDPCQELLRNDLVRIDICLKQRSDRTLKCCEFSIYCNGEYALESEFSYSKIRLSRRFQLILKFPVPHVDKMSGDRGGCGHHRRDEMCASAAALAAFEIAVAGRGTAFAGLAGCPRSWRGTSSIRRRAIRNRRR